MSLLDGTTLLSHPDGEVTIKYTDKATERLHLNSVKWKHTRKGQRPFLPPLNVPPAFPLTKIHQDANELKYYWSPHTVKAFADHLSVFYSTLSDHLSLLPDLSTFSRDLDLTFRPDKCISMIFDGKKMDHKTTFSLGNGSTCNIADSPTKILGKVVAGSYSSAKKAMATKLDTKITSVMD